MGSSLQSLTLSSFGQNGSVFVTGTSEFSFPNGMVGFRTVDADTVIAGITGSSSIEGLSYIVGKTLTAPYEGLIPFTSIRLTNGALQAFK